MNSLCNSIKSFYHVPSFELSNQPCSIVVGPAEEKTQVASGQWLLQGPSVGG